MALNFTSIHQRIFATLVGITSKWVSTRGLLKIPVFLLMLPLGLLLTILGMIGLICLAIALTPFYAVRYVLWRLSANGRIQHAQKKYQRRKQRIIRREQGKRLKLSQRVDKAGIQSLVKLSKNEIIKRKKHLDYRVFIQTKRRLNRCMAEMNFADAHRIHSAIVDTELDLLNETLIQLFK